MVVGAGVLARYIAVQLNKSKKVTLIDSNENNILKARELGLNAIQGDAIDIEVLFDAGIEDIGRLITLTPNAEVNILVLKMAREEYFVPQLYAAFEESTRQSIKNMAVSLNAKQMPGMLQYLSEYEKNYASVADIQTEEISIESEMNATEFSKIKAKMPILLKRGDSVNIVEGQSMLKPGDVVIALMQLIEEVV